jgi:hypothetical protein
VAPVLLSVSATSCSMLALRAWLTLAVSFHSGSLGRRASQGALHGSATSLRQRLALAGHVGALVPSPDPCLAAVGVAVARLPYCVVFC